MSPLHRFVFAVFVTVACPATPALAMGGKHPATRTKIRGHV